ncbi:hypothetical protein FXE84_01595 [Vibrio cholerae]|uniref:hypothetical protein n=1 Tax=Vibrio cholerae TaxID=666 RepID=UPI0004E367DF|nr:hypothetical protein [Vibrio cholerae]KFE28868.1 hypothetical protein DN30_268 [Vibrio cholerae]TXY44061.1 hypothetical protein FXE84_01595 [Vibrio cholerae]HAS7807789.1 hypothetical protein [Vibrio cholerae]
MNSIFNVIANALQLAVFERIATYRTNYLLAAVALLGRGLLIIIAYNFVAYNVENLIWGYRFHNFLDDLLFVYLLVEFFVILFLMWKNQRVADGVRMLA